MLARTWPRLNSPNPLQVHPFLNAMYTFSLLVRVTLCCFPFVDLSAVGLKSDAPTKGRQEVRACGKVRTVG